MTKKLVRWLSKNPFFFVMNLLEFWLSSLNFSQNQEKCEFPSFSQWSRGLGTTWYIFDLLFRTRVIDWWQPHGPTTFAAYFIEDNSQFSRFCEKLRETLKIQVKSWQKKDFWKSTEQLSCRFPNDLRVLGPHNTCISCCLGSGLSIGGNHMAPRSLPDVLWKETHNFVDFVKS